MPATYCGSPLDRRILLAHGKVGPEHLPLRDIPVPWRCRSWGLWGSGSIAKSGPNSCPRDHSCCSILLKDRIAVNDFSHRTYVVLQQLCTLRRNLRMLAFPLVLTQRSKWTYHHRSFFSGKAVLAGLPHVANAKATKASASAKVNLIVFSGSDNWQEEEDYQAQSLTHAPEIG